jgi:preprotein translocase subunit SecY
VFESLLNAFRAPDIRRRIRYVRGILIVFRFLAHVPVPGVDQAKLGQYLSNNALFSVLDLLSGGGLSSFSVVALGVNPYINASIIMQLMSGVIPSLQNLQREGEYGRNKINQYTRYLAVPMALLQSYGFLALLNSQQILSSGFDLANGATLTQIATLTAGSMTLMWLGELITEKGIGNGISFIIFAGIVSRAPTAIGGFGLGMASSWVQMFTMVAGAVVLMWLGELITEKGIGNGISFIIFAGIVSRAPAGLGALLSQPSPRDIVLFALLAIVAVAVIIYIQEGQRRIPIQYASRVRGRRMYQGGQTFLPLRVNLAGVIPIIFAISILQFPAQLAIYFSFSEVQVIRDVANGIAGFLSPTTIQYALLYFLLTVGFTYFYTAFTFKPDETAEQLRKNGGFIPGIRPGRPTQDYLARVVSRITIAGALFLGIVAVAPVTAGVLDPSLKGLAIGGTGVLIVVSVVVETMKQIEAQLMMRNYEGFIR